jgi:hypothetical protein
MQVFRSTAQHFIQVQVDISTGWKRKSIKRGAIWGKDFIVRKQILILALHRCDFDVDMKQNQVKGSLLLTEFSWSLLSVFNMSHLQTPPHVNLFSPLLSLLLSLFVSRTLINLYGDESYGATLSLFHSRLVAASPTIAFANVYGLPCWPLPPNTSILNVSNPEFRRTAHGGFLWSINTFHWTHFVCLEEHCQIR